MLQEDSNGENTFEIIDKKVEESAGRRQTDSMSSSISSSASLLPSPSVSVTTAVPGGNLLSNVSPPMALPNFIPTNLPPANASTVKSHPSPMPAVELTTASPLGKEVSPVSMPMSSTNLNVQTSSEPFYPTQFSAAIPPSKGVQHGTTQQDASQLTNQDSGGILSWMKEAVSSGGILSKVAEKAKSSVDSMITTLDPQMREYIYSGGDLDVLVASPLEVKISAVRESFQAVFGKATICGFSAQSPNIAPQPVGFAAGVKAAEERIQAVLRDPNIQKNPLPVVAIENFILEVGEDKWYDLAVLILMDPIKQINLQTFTQMTPIPASIVNLAQEDTPVDYPLRWSGLKVPISSLMANNLHVHHTEWYQALVGVSRRELLVTAAKTLATLYKNIIGQNN